MNANDKPIGERLLALEPQPAASRQQLQQELSAMFQRELSAFSRTFFGIVAVASIISGVVCAALAITEPDLPMVPRIGLGVGSLFGLAWAIVAGRISRRGALNLKVDSPRMAAMAWSFTVLLTTFFLLAGMSAKDPMQGIKMMLGALPFLIGAGVNLITNRIESAELNAQEKFLQLELRLATMSEQSK